MGYYACVKESGLKISDKEGLLKFLRNYSAHMVETWKDEDEELFDRLRYSLPVEDLIDVYDDGTIDFFSDEKYREEWWEPFAPFLKGYIEWYGEDTCIWRDVFAGGVIQSFYPEIIWPLGATDEEMADLTNTPG